MRRVCRALVSFALVCGSGLLLAADVPARPAPVMPASPLNLLLGVGFLLALVAGAWWLLRRAGGMQWSTQRNAMKVVAALSVGPRERVVLVEVGGQQMLLGVAPGRVNLLHRFDTPVITDGGHSDEFADRLRQVLQNSFGSHK